jgi:isoleucyl-tRNA synthetase
LNDARKSAGLEIADRIAVTIDADETLRAVIETHRETITTEILARSIEFGNGDRIIEIDGSALSITILRVD